jgi:small GTP-binding protein
MSEGNTGTTNQAQTSENTTEGTPEQPQKTLMFAQDEQTQQWQILPVYYEYFMNEFAIIQALQDTLNPDWTEDQANLYNHFLNTIGGLISGVFNGTYYYYEDYQAWVEYSSKQNPIGFDLYQKQFKYLQYIQKKQDKEMNKGNKDKAPKVEQPKVKPKETVVEEKIIVRSGDPEISIQKLFSTQWDPVKYLQSDFLAKENANIVFIGHVDSGKSTLTGNIIKELKEVDEQELARNKQDAKQNKMEAWEDAAISDVIPEERVDGKTREYAKLNFFLEKKRFTLFDAPGHKNYVPNMIMGACQADIAVLIISAKEGEFESGFEKEGQTKEHAMLAKALGVVELIAVVTKMGTVDWNQKRFEHIQEQVQPFLDINCGFGKVTFIPVDSLQNKNIHARIPDSWYKGPSFTEYLDNLVLPERKPMGPLRIPVIDKFKDLGQLYVYGKVESGTIIEDQTVTILPQRIQMVIR